MKRWLCGAVICAMVGCVSITPEQKRLYALYKSDPRAPKSIENNHKVNEWEMAAFSIIIPGLGHVLMGEYGYAVVWFFGGLISPFVAPVAAVADARTVSEIQVGEAYQKYLDEIKSKKSSDDVATEGFCHACGSKMRADARYCPFCGRPR